jgi:hypothetical protein
LNTSSGFTRVFVTLRGRSQDNQQWLGAVHPVDCVHGDRTPRREHGHYTPILYEVLSCSNTTLPGPHSVTKIHLNPLSRQKCCSYPSLRVNLYRPICWCWHDLERSPISSVGIRFRGGSQSGKKVNIKRPLHPHIVRSLELLKHDFAPHPGVSTTTTRVNPEDVFKPKVLP